MVLEVEPHMYGRLCLAYWQKKMPSTSISTSTNNQVDEEAE